MRRSGAAFGPTPGEALDAAAEMTCRTFEAPLDLALRLQITTELDPGAGQELCR
ncbi:hypothetical protein ACFQ6N_35405 [Kitasatospora sp. NPDC056446]|uniref:hypothetical protein n=1 Tax=Kitasatospora sp. NPDC056446 TaxID=3345819 RepID=UPI0036C4598E